MKYESTRHIVANGKHYSPGDDLSEVRTSTLRCMLRLGQAAKVEDVQPIQVVPLVVEAEPVELVSPPKKKRGGEDKKLSLFAGGDKE